MRASDKRILTTQVGSLPRSEAVVALLERRENGEALDAAVFKTTIGAAVTDIVRRQVDLGIDVVSDGETSKMSYATYVKDRLTGFSDEGSTEPTRPHLDLQPFPDLQRKMALLTGKRRFKRVACIGKIAYCGQAALAEDVANMRRAVDGGTAHRRLPQRRFSWRGRQLSSETSTTPRTRPISRRSPRPCARNMRR